MMSRVIIRNIPKGMTEEKLRSHFDEGLYITDCSLKYTKDGVFRHFAFVGFKTEQDAELVVKKYNKSFLNTSRISIEIAKDLGDDFKPRAWSRYSKESSTFQQTNKDTGAKQSKASLLDKDKKKRQKESRDKKVDELFGELTCDPEFQEFLELHKARDNKSTWSNDANLPGIEHTTQTDDVTSGSETDGEKEVMETSESDDNESDSSDQEAKNKPIGVSKKGLDDLDYLKLKLSTSKRLLDDPENSSSSDDDSDDNDDDGSSSFESEDEQSSKRDNKLSQVNSADKEKIKYIVKMKGLPVTVKDAQIKDFFKPIIPVSIKIPQNAKGSKTFCFATVEFSSLLDQEQAMGRNKNFIGSKRVYLHKSQLVEKVKKQEKPRAWEDKLHNVAEDGEQESIAESGRLYVRNLAYCCQQQDLEEMFSKFGPLVEVHLPIDKFTKKIKGFAFVTFMMPEHAVKAFTDLDGKVFQGRMLHILPARAARDQEETDDKMTFKKKKEQKQKSQAGSSHNWNSLFLGANAVADVMAEKYSTTKSRILDANENQSLGVRMALGESQIVAETRDFLLDSGVLLDSFSQPGGARSKTVILVKNLPASTRQEEITTLFDKFGTLGRVLLPPSGITAIVEFIEPTEAKSSFRNLAYTKFKHLPLYLEWAPAEVFRSTAYQSKPTTLTVNEAQEEEDTPTQPGFTLFVKNLNFDTTEDTVKQVFVKCGKVNVVNIAKKKDMKNSGRFLSMGYGFVEFAEKSGAEKALKTLQHKDIDGHAVELKLSNKATINKRAELGKLKRKKQDGTAKPTTKIAIRNIPFEAKAKEVHELFSVFGELKFCRLPKKLSGSGAHRGFGFVEFLTKNDAKRAFDTLCHSTHLYGRRLVLEWANNDETVDELRHKTAHYFFDGPPSKQLKKSKLIEELKAGNL